MRVNDIFERERETMGSRKELQSYLIKILKIIKVGYSSFIKTKIPAVHVKKFLPILYSFMHSTRSSYKLVK